MGYSCTARPPARDTHPRPQYVRGVNAGATTAPAPGSVAQPAEQPPRKRQVPSSTLGRSSSSPRPATDPPGRESPHPRRHHATPTQHDLPQPHRQTPVLHVLPKMGTPLVQVRIPLAILPHLPRHPPLVTMDRAIHQHVHIGAWCPKHDASHLITTRLYIITHRGVWRSHTHTQCA